MKNYDLVPRESLEKEIERLREKKHYVRVRGLAKTFLFTMWLLTLSIITPLMLDNYNRNSILWALYLTILLTAALALHRTFLIGTSVFINDDSPLEELKAKPRSFLKHLSIEELQRKEQEAVLEEDYEMALKIKKEIRRR